MQIIIDLNKQFLFTIQRTDYSKSNYHLNCLLKTPLTMCIPPMASLRKFANAAAAMAVSLSRTNYFESGKKGTNNSEMIFFLCSKANWLS